MPLRQIEIVIKDESLDLLLEQLEENGDMERILGISNLKDNLVSVRLATSMDNIEAITDRVENAYQLKDNARIFITGMEAMLPRLEESEKKPEDESASDQKSDSEQEKVKSAERLHREELYHDLNDGARLTRNNVILTLLAAVVAAIGLIRDSEEILIGAMVIAPMLAPNIALALATTLGDQKLALRAVINGAVSSVLVLAVSVLMGLLLNYDETLGSFTSRTSIEASDLILALAAGIAGTLCTSMGTATAVVGVMVAVALLPPLVACGLLMGAGLFESALGAGALYVANIIGLNLAGVFTFYMQGVRPGLWREEAKARRATVGAFAIWLALFVALFMIAYFFNH